MKTDRICLRATCNSEINISLLSLQKQPNTAPNLFQRGVEYGKYDKHTINDISRFEIMKTDRITAGLRFDVEI